MVESNPVSQFPPGEISGQREKIDALNTLAWELSIQNDFQKSQQLALQAFELASQMENSGSPYAYGLAFSLVNQSIVNTELGQLTLALAQVNQALGLIDRKTHPELAAEAEHQLGWIYTNAGSHQIALNQLLLARKAFEEIGLINQQVQVLNSLGGVYAELGDTDRAIESLNQALAILSDQKDHRDRAVTYNNLAHTLTKAGQFEQALPHALHGLELTSRLNLPGLELVLRDTLGSIYLGLGQCQAARASFLGAQSLAQARGTTMIELDARINLCAVCLAEEDYVQAESSLLNTLTTAEFLGIDAILARLYEMFSVLYDQQGMHSEALAYYRQFHEKQVAIFQEDSARNLENLQNAHLVENALKDAEIYRFKSLALQKEIDESNLIRAELEEIVRLDPLTGIYNRRYIFQIATDILEQAQNVKVPVSVMMMDIDLFKSINDTYGHLAGDQVLIAAVHSIQQRLRLTDYFGRYGGDEFVVILPNTDFEQAELAGERLRENLENHPIATDRGLVRVTISVGIASCEPEDGLLIDELLNMADAALYRAKKAGRNQMRVFLKKSD